MTAPAVLKPLETLMTTAARGGGVPAALRPQAPAAADLYEQERLRLLRSTGLLNAQANAAFDRVTRLAAMTFNVPIALMSLVEDERQWFKSRVGLDLHGIPRGDSFCTHTVASAEPLVVQDTHEDPRFADNPYVVGFPGVRFYAGTPLVTPSGHALGSLCIIDTKPRRFVDQDVRLLQDLSRLIMSHIPVPGAAAAALAAC